MRSHQHQFSALGLDASSGGPVSAVMSAGVDEQLRGHQQNLVSQLRTGSGFSVSRRRNSESEPTRLSKISVFIAHSDPLISAGLAVLLRKSRKFKVLCFVWERSTLRLAEHPTGSADIVIADYDTGIRLTTSAPESNGRIVILTHSDSQTKICHALAQGVRGYLLLGCSPQDLVAGIRSVHEGGVAVAPRVASRIAECMNQEALTAREQTVLRRMTLGWSNKRIARELGLAVGTVKTHIKGILAKLGAINRGEAVAIARRRGILPDEIEWQEPWSTRRLCVRKDVSISRRAG